ncbi:MAG: VIT1/CCC1 transporter family protein [Pseudomonadota bacterium]
MAALDGWREEKQSAYLYHVLAAAEENTARSKMFAELARAAEAQADIWAENVRREGGAAPEEFHPPPRARLVAALIRLFGPRRLRPMLAAIKVRGLSVYNPPAPQGHAMPTSVEDFGHRHRGTESGGNLRAAVFGVNDGLVSNTSLIMSVAGAGVEPKTILLAGIAGLLAGALSMAAGEYVSMRSQREMYEYQIGLEREELEQYPEQEAEELALIYHARGVDMDEARSLARNLLKNPEHALDTLAREELGLNPQELGSPWGAALSSLLAFSAGAVVPLLPFLWTQKSSTAAMSASAILAGASLFAVGAVLSLYTGRKAVYSGVRMVLIGAGAGVISYLIGAALGVGLG